MAKYFELILFTASIRDYAEPVINELDPDQLIKIRLFRENCSVNDHKVCKDLSILGRNLKDIIIVDNSSQSFQMQPSNGIHVKTYTGTEGNDDELIYMMPFLIFLSRTYDVRKVSTMYKRYFSRKYIRFQDHQMKEAIFDKISVQNEVFKKYQQFNDKFNQNHQQLLQNQLENIEEDDDIQPANRKSFINGKDHFVELRNQVYPQEIEGNCSSDACLETTNQLSDEIIDYDKAHSEELNQLSDLKMGEQESAKISHCQSENIALSSSDTVDIPSITASENSKKDNEKEICSNDNCSSEEKSVQQNNDEIYANMMQQNNATKNQDIDILSLVNHSSSSSNSNEDCNCKCGNETCANEINSSSQQQILQSSSQYQNQDQLIQTI
eukprot:TRINITY_DN2226_c0_g1_i3.p1 TRINITY_DN2226_c0_g1~~TRINITY_DN2226_c0_g1_i3.p1  ORF type:complete len:382 (+),score=64.91 TRINITY_DN2226_c0_g1_i3:623-1768(+)